MKAKPLQKNIPNGWNAITLDKLLIEVGTRNKNSDDLPVLSVTNSRGFVLQSEQFARKLHSTNTKNYKVVSSGEFGYNPARINVGSIATLESPKKGLLSPMYVVFKTGRDLETDYLKQYIQTNKFNLQVKGNTAGSVRQSLNFSAFKNFDFLLPPIKEQKKIAEILGAVDEEIQKIDQVIVATEKLKKGLVQELFSKYEGNKKVKIKEVAEVTSSKRVMVKDYVEEGVPFYRSTEIIKKSKNIPVTNPLYISSEKFNEFKNKFGAPKSGDLLITAVGTIGDVYLVRENETFYFKDGNSVWIRKIKDSVLPEYLKAILASSFYREKLNNIVGGSSQKALTIQKLESVDLPIPSIAEQEKITDILSSVDQKISINQKIKAELTLLKKGLMQDLLSGKKRTI